MKIYFKVECAWENPFETHNYQEALRIAKKWHKEHECVVYINRIVIETLYVIKEMDE